MKKIAISSFRLLIAGALGAAEGKIRIVADAQAPGPRCVPR
jgi:hypothetical protein